MDIHLMDLTAERQTIYRIKHPGYFCIHPRCQRGPEARAASSLYVCSFAALTLLKLALEPLARPKKESACKLLSSTAGFPGARIKDLPQET